ncbi:MAG: hypothetical protein IH604_21215 [Burkholderiales bacterium]|nr:hypothetical protein [Burkholderiales bacterium]
MNLIADADLDSMRFFIVASGGFYPEFAADYDEVMNAYLDKFLTEDETEQEAA